MEIKGITPELTIGEMLSSGVIYLLLVCVVFLVPILIFMPDGQGPKEPTTNRVIVIPTQITPQTAKAKQPPTYLDRSLDALSKYTLVGYLLRSLRPVVESGMINESFDELEQMGEYLHSGKRLRTFDELKTTRKKGIKNAPLSDTQF